jgi:hypothetical protein
MQYLLTQDEFYALQRRRAAQKAEQKTALQALCMLAADHVPVHCHWHPDEPPHPWGCILSEGENNPGYCDLCPAKDVCPYEGKKFSK